MIRPSRKFMPNCLTEMVHVNGEVVSTGRSTAELSTVPTSRRGRVPMSDVAPYRPSNHGCKAVRMPTLGSMFAATEDDSFLGFRSIEGNDSLDGVDIAVIGAPCATPYASVGPYCKDAPAAIRAAS